MQRCLQEKATNISWWQSGQRTGVNFLADRHTKLEDKEFPEKVAELSLHLFRAAAGE